MRDGHVTPKRHQIARGEEPDRQRYEYAERRCKHGDFDTFSQAFEQDFPAREIRRKHATDKARAVVEAD